MCPHVFHNLGLAQRNENKTLFPHVAGAVCVYRVQSTEYRSSTVPSMPPLTCLPQEDSTTVCRYIQSCPVKPACLPLQHVVAAPRPLAGTHAACTTIPSARARASPSCSLTSTQSSRTHLHHGGRRARTHHPVRGARRSGKDWHALARGRPHAGLTYKGGRRRCGPLVSVCLNVLVALHCVKRV